MPFRDKDKKRIYMQEWREKHPDLLSAEAERAASEGDEEWPPADAAIDRLPRVHAGRVEARCGEHACKSRLLCQVADRSLILGRV